MKPPETITLIDLEGKPIYELTTPKSCFYTPVEELIATSMYNNVGYRESNPAKLINFLNDQLTFIRNGMWETLAIYQATLGRYTDVPWYRLSIDCLRETKQMGKLIKLLDNNNVEATGFYQFGGIESPIFNAENVKGLEYETVRVSLDYFKAWKPNYNDFIQYYHDIFSKLTPLEGK